MRIRDKKKPFSHGQWAKKSLAFLFGVVVFFSSTAPALAGFGISPPYVFNNRLTRGTVFNQQITLVRSDPTDDLTTTITMNIPEVQSWFSVDRGTTFTMPKGQRQVPIVVTVTVPEDADYARYKGSIRVRTAPAISGAPEGGGVSIALGAQIDVDVEVVDKIYDFEVRKIRIDDLEEGRRKWGLFFPGKIKFYMTIENTGNTEYGPTKVTFDIYDSEGETLLETTQNTNKLSKVPPFGNDEIVAELPTRLSAGKYIAKYTIYKGDDIAQQNEINVSIAAIGAVAGYEGYGFIGLSTADKLKVVIVLGAPLLLVLLGGAFFVRRVRRSKRNTRSSGVGL